MIPASEQWHWPELIAPFGSALGPLQRTAPILGGCDARVGLYRDAPVWLVWHRADSTRTPSTSVTIATPVGDHPITGYLIVRDARAPLEVLVGPPEIAANALDDEARDRVDRSLRELRRGMFRFHQGFLTTSAEFRSDGLFGGSHRPPSPAETAMLIDDLVHLAARFRRAYEAYFDELQRTCGSAAAQAWVARAHEAIESDRRRSRKVLFVAYSLAALLGLGLVIVALMIAAAFGAW